MQGHTQEGAKELQHVPNKNLKNTDSVDKITLNVLCDLAFSQNQPQKLTDD